MKHEYRGYSVEFEQEEDAVDPRREFDHATTMICFHKRYNLGDRDHGFRQQDYGSWDELETAIFAKYNPVAIRPLYMYDHGGITISTGPFSCPWDSGQIGFVFVTKQQLLKWQGAKRMSEKLRSIAVEHIAGDVKLYDNYLTGEVYRYVIKDPDGEELAESSSVGGWYGSETLGEEGDPMKEAKATIDHEIEERERMAKPENHPDQMTLGMEGVK